MRWLSDTLTTSWLRARLVPSVRAPEPEPPEIETALGQDVDDVEGHAPGQARRQRLDGRWPGLVVAVPKHAVRAGAKFSARDEGADPAARGVEYLD